MRLSQVDKNRWFKARVWVDIGNAYSRLQYEATVEDIRKRVFIVPVERGEHRKGKWLEPREVEFLEDARA